MPLAAELKQFDKKIKHIKSLLSKVMITDRRFALREIERLQGKKAKTLPANKLRVRIDRLEQRLQKSRHKWIQRIKNVPQFSDVDALPITAKKADIVKAIKQHPVVIVSGETGSGKTTQLPKYCLAAGQGMAGIIGHTQPRRIAAMTVAHRIAEEFGQDLGDAVGYKIRFQDRTTPKVYLKIMTDGILLAETQSDRYLTAYDTIIVDEAHERSLNIDFILGILQALRARRDDLKLIITSATIDTKKFSKAFGDAPVIEVSGRMYPVDVRYQTPESKKVEKNEETHVERAAQAIRQLVTESSSGDLLVFMPTEQDIRDTCELIEGSKLKKARILPLYARLTAAEQARVFARSPERKIIVAPMWPKPPLPFRKLNMWWIPAWRASPAIRRERARPPCRWCRFRAAVPTSAKGVADACKMASACGCLPKKTISAAPCIPGRRFCAPIWLKLSCE